MARLSHCSIGNIEQMCYDRIGQTNEERSGQRMEKGEKLTLSGLQHFAFCRRQWALIFIEQQWQENLRTAEGNAMHRRAHDETQIERRGDTLVVRGLRVASERLNVTGVCDVVEFHESADGVALYGQEGRWAPYPVEYKRGAPKEHDADALQLCGQAMCLEEMLLCAIPEGSLYYGETRRRERVAFSPELRGRVEALLGEMQGYMERGYTPKAKMSKGCNACSLKALCLPKLSKSMSVDDYLRQAAKEADVS